jgi:prepilin-type N-terminal cleavage/methylation domain-containing protein
MIRRLKKQNGFTLIEVVCGMVILTLGLLLLLPMMVTSIQANDFARGSTEASMLIKDKMEDLKNTSNPASGADTVDSVMRNWNVTLVSANLLQLTVTVNWNDHQGRARHGSMTSYMSRR